MVLPPGGCHMACLKESSTVASPEPPLRLQMELSVPTGAVQL